MGYHQCMKILRMRSDPSACEFRLGRFSFMRSASRITNFRLSLSCVSTVVLSSKSRRGTLLILCFFLENPPFRPIISQIGTITYELSKKLNELIIPYLPRKFNVKSTYEFLSLLRENKESGTMASLDVSDLFTNVLVSATIDIIIRNVYNHPHLPPLEFPPECLAELLKICTTCTPFRHINGDIYVQKEGVSMGSRLGPTFADFYMCNLENKIFEENPNLLPSMYARYVDDIFMVVQSSEQVDAIKSKFEELSVLKFKCEHEKARSLVFLDTVVTRFQTDFHTAVYTKDTNAGDCINYKSACPERYKVAVIKTLHHRGYHVSSDWKTFDLEKKNEWNNS